MMRARTHNAICTRTSSPPPPPSRPGEGKPKVLDDKETTVYKRALDVEYKLKMKASR
jgi:hypothetical protein